MGLVFVVGVIAGFSCAALLFMRGFAGVKKYVESLINGFETRLRNDLGLVSKDAAQTNAALHQWAQQVKKM